MRVILVIVCMVLGFGVSAQKDSAAVSDVYRGVLPCADCSGLQTELTLTHAPNAGMGTYILKETYTGTDRVVETKGEWTHHQGIPGDKNATVIDMYDPENPDVASHYYLRLKDGSIKLLDENMRGIKNEANYVLRRE